MDINLEGCTLEVLVVVVGGGDVARTGWLGIVSGLWTMRISPCYIVLPAKSINETVKGCLKEN